MNAFINFKSFDSENLTNFEKLSNIVSSLGTTYNPTRAQIRPSYLKTSLLYAKISTENYNNAMTVYSMVSAEREKALNYLCTLSDKIITEIKRSDTVHHSGTLALLQRLIIFKEKLPPIVFTIDHKIEIDHKKIEFLQKCYDYRLNFFSELIDHLELLEDYKPTDDDIRISTLKYLVDTIKQKNRDVKLAYNTLRNCRIERDRALYSPISGLYDLSTSIKSYIESILSKADPRVKAISKLNFRS
jgi:hypothetical protein